MQADLRSPLRARGLTARPGARAKLTFQEIRSVHELEAIEGEWRDLWERAPESTPFSSPAWLLPWCRHLASVAPCAVAVWSRRRLAGLAPTLVYTSGSERVLGLLGGAVSDYQDVLVEDGETARAVLTWLLRRGDAFDRAVLESMPPWSALVRAAAGSKRARLERQDVCPALALPRSFGELGAQASERLLSDLRYQERRLARDGGYRFVDATVSNRAHLLSELFRLHAARWVARGGQGILHDVAVRQFHEEATSGLLSLGVLRLTSIEVDGRTVGVLYGFTFRGRTSFYLHGIDPAASNRSLGTVLIAHAIERAIAEGCTEFDFLRGAEPYKYRWGARDRAIVKLSFDPEAARAA